MFRVATYNIRKGIGTDRMRKPERIIEVLCEIDADIVALQEADRRFGSRVSAIPLELLRTYSDYDAVDFDHRAQSIGYHGNAILVKRSHKVRAAHIIAIPTLEPRGAVAADVELGKTTMRFVGMHLDLSGLRRRQQVRSILSRLGQNETMPTILVGDLNEWSRHGGCLPEFSATHQMVATPPSFHSRRPIARLDRIMVSRDIEIRDSGTHRSAKSQRASDHLPVWADLAC